MAARTRRTELSEEWKNRIKSGMILDRLLKHVNGDIELKPTQIKAAEILLKKVIPDLASTTLSAEITHNYVIRAAQPAVTPEQWQQQHPEVTIQ